MSIINYGDPTITVWEVNDDGEKISIPVTNERKQVVGNKIVLEGLPDSQSRVYIDGLVELDIKDKITEPNQFKVDYRRDGIVFFHESMDGEWVTIGSYSSRGVYFLPASRIWTKTDGNGNVTELLSDIIEGLNSSSIVSSERDRIANEKSRVDSESERVSSEGKRIDEEDIRKLNEQVRIDTEQDRINAEGARVNEEAIRVASEEIRVSSERERETQNSERGQEIVVATESVNAKIEEVETRFGNLTAQQQQDSEVIDAREGKASLVENLEGMIVQGNEVGKENSEGIIPIDAGLFDGKKPEYYSTKEELAQHKLDYVEQVGNTANLTTTSKVVVNAINEKANKVQEEWITPTLLNGAEEYAGHKIAYMKDSMGFVHFKGAFLNPPLGVKLFDLPIEYRPSQTVYFPVVGGSSAGRGTIGSFFKMDVGSLIIGIDHISYKAGA